MQKAWLRKHGKKIALEYRRARKAQLGAGGGGEEEGQAGAESPDTWAEVGAEEGGEGDERGGAMIWASFLETHSLPVPSPDSLDLARAASNGTAVK